MKLVVIGDTSVGKTSLVVRYFDKKFDERGNQATLGIDFKQKVKG